MTGIVAYGTYIPERRLDRKAAGIGRGTRSIASHDEDSTSLGVEAARRALAVSPAGSPGLLTFATTSPAYADRTNATAVHAALHASSPHLPVRRVSRHRRSSAPDHGGPDAAKGPEGEPVPSRRLDRVARRGNARLPGVCIYFAPPRPISQTVIPDMWYLF